MLRHFAQPLDAGISHGGVGVQAFGDRMADDGLAFLFEQGDELLLLLDQPLSWLAKFPRPRSNRPNHTV